MACCSSRKGHCFRDQALAWCGTPPPDPSQRIEGTSLSTLVQMVGAGLGITLIPQMAVELERGAAPIDIAPACRPLSCSGA